MEGLLFFHSFYLFALLSILAILIYNILKRKSRSTIILAAIVFVFLLVIYIGKIQDVELELNEIAPGD